MSDGKPPIDTIDKERLSADTNSTLTASTVTNSSTTTEGGVAQSQEPAVPPTFFGSISRSYADVPITEDGVDTIAFIEASEGVLALFDLLGPTAFGMVIKDMSGNINKVRTRFLAAPLVSGTLEQLVENEAKEPKRTATQGLLWLLRGLQFTCIALRRSQNDHSEPLTQSFTKAYHDSLGKYHSFVMKPLFALAMKACPERNDFYAKLGPLDCVNIELNAWLDGLDKIVGRVQDFFEKGNFAKGF